MSLFCSPLFMFIWKRRTELCRVQGAGGGTLVTAEKTPLKRQFLNLGKIRLSDLILKCVMV